MRLRQGGIQVNGRQHVRTLQCMPHTIGAGSDCQTTGIRHQQHTLPFDTRRTDIELNGQPFRTGRWAVQMQLRNSFLQFLPEIFLESRGRGGAIGLFSGCPFGGYSGTNNARHIFHPGPAPVFLSAARKKICHAHLAMSIENSDPFGAMESMGTQRKQRSAQ